MASPNIFHGSIINITVNGLELACGTDATLTFTANTTENPACKPLSTENFTQGGWSSVSISNKTWEITGSSQAVADAVLAGQITDAGLLELFMTDPIVTVTMQTTVTPNYPYATVRVFEGSGIMTGFTWNAPGDANSSSDFTITGNGEPTFTSEPFTT